MEDELEHPLLLALVADHLEAPRKTDDVRVVAERARELRVEQPRRDPRLAVLGEDLARAGERRVDSGRDERPALLRDVQVEIAVARLVLQPPELEQPTAERELDPPVLAQPRRAVEQPVEVCMTLQDLPRHA